MDAADLDLDDSFSVTCAGTTQDAAALWDLMVAFNSETGPMLRHPPYEPYRVIIRDGKGKIVGGILAKIYLKAMYVELLMLDASLRKKGLGSKLLAGAEARAREAGCTFMHLDTFTFQAIDFYPKFGYEVYAVLDDFPDGIKRYYLKKKL